MNKLFALVAVCLSLTSTALRAEIDIIQIGGGSGDPAQGQIEANVIWLNELLPKVSRKVTNFFGSGNSKEKDVAYWSQDSVSNEMLPLARVFEDAMANQVVYRNNLLTSLEGSTTKKTMSEKLGKKMSAVPTGGEVLLIYNGHGGLARLGSNENYLRLWKGGQMTVSEVDAIFDRAPTDATIRFIFPQCFSGAFQRLVYEKPGSLKLTTQNRCGFFSQSAYLESEGCSLDISKASFRDYTTYYFAPLYGKTRTDQPLPDNPDINGDGRLSYREGHLYMLRNAESKDLARSTAEAFLEDWEPWFLRWESWTENRNSPYWELAERISARSGLGRQELSLFSMRLSRELHALKSQEKSVREEVERNQEAIKSRVKMIWPELLHPYTAAYAKLLRDDLVAVATFIKEDKDYARLSRDQDTLVKLKQDQLEIERRIAQVDKVVHFKKLARLEAQFERFASDAEKASYRRLLSCEEGNLAPVVRK